MRKERVYDALSHKKTDFIPHNVELTKELMGRFCRYAGIEPGEYANFAENHIAKLTLNEKDVPLGDDLFRDDHGVVFDRSYDKDIGAIREYLIPEPDAGLIHLPPIERESVAARVSAGLNNGGDCFKFAKISFTLFERAWSLCGFENLFCYLLTDKPFVKALLGAITERNLALLDIALQQDVDGVYFGDDYGAQRGLLFSPEIFRELFLPHWEAMLGLARRHGKITCLHSCGDISDILPMLHDAGLDVYQTVQPEIYDFHALKGAFPRLSFYGGISVQRDLPVLSPGEIDPLVRQTADVLGKGGGYIAAPTHQVTDDVPVENVMALIESLKSLRAG